MNFIKRPLYDLLRIPYYRCLIAKHNEVIGTKIVRQKGNLKDFTYGAYKAKFILPDDKKTGIPPLKIKSGHLLVHDINSAIAMKLVTKAEDGIEWMDEEIRKEYIINPKQFYLTPLDAQELNTYLESKIVEDILSDNEKKFPMWLIILICVALAVCGVIAVVYLVTHGTPAIINQTILQMPTPEPTMYIVPGV